MAYATDGRGGGNAMPSYLTPQNSPITPMSQVVPGENRSPISGLLNPIRQARAGATGFWANLQKRLAQRRNVPVQGPRPTHRFPQPAARVPGLTPKSKAKPTDPMQQYYNFLKSDLERERTGLRANAIGDASSRGVYYGTPLTTSFGDIDTEYLRGLGQLQASMFQNEQQNQLERMRIGAGLIGQTPMAEGGGIDPAIIAQLGTLFGRPPTSGPITPNPRAGQQVPGVVTEGGRQYN